MDKTETTCLTIVATKPKRVLARLLQDMGIHVLPASEPDGKSDRYIISKRVVVERRTGRHFIQGIMDKTLFTSAIYMREHFEIPILIIEGDVNYEYTAFSPLAVRGALCSMMLQYGITVLSTPNREETVNLIAMFVHQEQIGIPEISLVPKRKAVELPDLQRRVVEMLPGCGMITARALLQHFGTINCICNATKSELAQVRGIGAKMAANMYRVLNAEYEAIDTERNLEDAIEAEPGLLFDEPIKLLARQHHIYTEDGRRHIVDLVFRDSRMDELVLVELKRGRLLQEHEEQLQRYLDHANQSTLLADHLSNGSRIRGLLATISQCRFKPRNKDISVCIIAQNQVIDVLRGLRHNHY